MTDQVESKRFSISKLEDYETEFLRSQRDIFDLRMNELADLCRLYSNKSSEAEDKMRTSGDLMESMQEVQSWKGLYEAANSMFEDVMKKKNSCTVELHLRELRE